MTTQQIDQAKAEAFAGQMLGILNSASLALLASIGHQTGLFDKLANLPPSTSDQIASATGLNERYVREWLAGMVTGRIMDYDPSGKTYRLPPEHAAFLTREAGPNNMATFAQFIPLFAKVEPQLLDSFRNGGGVPYSEFTTFQHIMAEESAGIVDATLISVTLPLVPGLIERLKGGIDVLDVGCGQGHAINTMAKEFPNSRFTGYDFSAEGVAAGQSEARQLGLSNSRFVEQDASKFDVTNAFDLITAFDAIHDQAQPRQVLANISKALRSGGTFLMVDIAGSSNLEENLDHPLGPMMYTCSTAHCMTVSLALGGEGLGTMWGEQLARSLLADAGFTNVEVKGVEGDMFNAYYVCRKD